MKILEYIRQAKKEQRKLLAILIDPDKISNTDVLISSLKSYPPDLIFIGGSSVEKSQFDLVIEAIYKNNICPVIIFPGDHKQVSDYSDAILLLSLISGRNPEYLIGQHVKAAQTLERYNGDVIPTSYVLVNGFQRTSVQEISQTEPLNPNDIDLIVDTVIAGKLMGHQLHYLEAGSGAKKSIPSLVIKSVSACSPHPIIVGGGIRDIETARDIWQAGADVIVVGNGFEDRPSLLEELLGSRS
ncbi:MAG: geranylgeranylglyceryl/heptaprenylglyceryl phosphate synthase [Flavobacteriales bacterium]|nr:geranylgeranylglyceryl/heptaprenylglyceryl phosphate synthase [Flavobacteriales bacterium]